MIDTDKSMDGSEGITMVFFFTGTGNSLYAAKGIEPAPYSIPQVIHNTPLEFTAHAIGIVCPVYGHEVPAMVRDGKAVHTPGSCQTCLSCVHNCPEKAIGLSIPEKNPHARYRNAHISLAEIIGANQQEKS